MASKNYFIQISIFDRLAQDDDQGIIAGHIKDFNFVRQAVLRDVENLLNTRRKLNNPTKEYRYLNDSLYIYGLDDFVSKNPKSLDVQKKLKACIEETITKFEPRLVSVNVDFNPEEGNEQNLCFAVKATLYADPVRQPICFDTWFSVNRGEYHINNVR